MTAFADIFDAVRYNLNSLSEFIENLDVHVGTDGAFVEGELGFSAVKWWSALVNGEDSFQDSYSNYVSSLDSTVVDNCDLGSLGDPVASTSSDVVDILSPYNFHVNSDRGGNFTQIWSVSGDGQYTFTCSLPSCSCGSSHKYGSSGVYLFQVYKPEDDSWYKLAEISSGEFTIGLSSNYSYRFYINYWELYGLSGGYHSISSGISVKSASGGSFNPDSGAGRPGTETRAGAFMKAISGYNSDTNQYNFFIGTTDSSGKVNNVYDPAIFDEASMIFTEPVTGQQYQCTGWKYGYASAARGYRLDLAEDTYSYNGKDIRTLCLFYLDDALYIVGLDQVYSDYFNDNSSVNDFFSNAVFIDKYSYVTAEATGEGSETCQHVYTSETITVPTCVEQGIRRYTCTLCGHTRDEKIPATGHAWEVTETVETEVNENGDVTKLGYKVYTCSVCGETYKQYDNTGQPGPPSGGGSVEDESWFSWLGDLFKSLISAIVNGLASGLEYLVETVIVTVTDLTIQTTQWVFSSLHISDLTTWFVWFDDGNPLFQDEFGQDTEETEVDVWAYSLG